MHICKLPIELQPCRRPTAVALGMFDGVHLGHQHVIRQSQLDARALGGRSVVVTFDPHPLAILKPGSAPRLLQSLPQRLRAFQQLGVDEALILEFKPELSRLTGDEFVRSLHSQIPQLRSFTVGEGFVFGYRRSGDIPLLRTLGDQLGFCTHAVAPIRIGDEMVSSTRIRAVLREGDLEHVAELLGRPYAITGTVLHGDGLGRQLGFPTANLDVNGLELPPTGVYAAWARQNENLHAAAVNIGHRPTVSSCSELRFECHLLDTTPDLYGRELEVELVRRLRSERSFASLEDLKKQIAVDIVDVRRHLAMP
jgi:riboflavin kinase / FMN adenylyltransferase